MRNVELPSIQAWFVPREAPFGLSQREIDQEWVGVPLPLRYDNNEPIALKAHRLEGKGEPIILDERDGLYVLKADAIKALRLFGKPEIAEFWETNIAYSIKRVIFEKRHGQIYSTPDLSLILPGVEFFDQTDAA